MVAERHVKDEYKCRTGHRKLPHGFARVKCQVFSPWWVIEKLKAGLNYLFKIALQLK